MRFFRTLSAFALALMVASVAFAAQLNLPRLEGSGPIAIPDANPITVDVCAGKAGVTINAVSANPLCVTVAPAAAVTGANGCATFTLTCVNGACVTNITWTAAGFGAVVRQATCTVVGANPPDGTAGGGNMVPTMGEWGLIFTSLLLLGAGIVALRARRA